MQPQRPQDDMVAEEDEQLVTTPVEVVLDTQYTDDLLGLACELAPAEVADTKEFHTVMKADELIEDWMKHSVLLYIYVFDGAPPLPEVGDCMFHKL